VRVVEGGLALLIVIKLTDLLLGRPKGLAILAPAIAALYAALAAIAMSPMADGFSAYCIEAQDLAKAQTSAATAAPYIDAACRYAGIWPLVLAAIVFVAGLGLLRPELQRGLNDAGFIANTFRAERRRRQGL
jgi:hypothetical protein